MYALSHDKNQEESWRKPLSSETALLVIDIQVGFFKEAQTEDDPDPVFQGHEIIERLRSIISQAHKINMPVIYIQHCGPKGHPLEPHLPEWQIHPDIVPCQGDTIIYKSASDSFYHTELDHELKTKGIKSVVITGCQTEYCVDATSRSALSHGYDVVLVSDAHTTGDTDVLQAPQIIAHHNALLANIAHPDHKITLKTAKDLLFDMSLK